MFAPRTCFVDVETTGTDPSRDRITEVAVVAVDQDGAAVRVTEWSSLVNPGVPIPSEISWLTGITDPMVRVAPPFSQLAERLYDTLEDAVFVAHNARFDFGFLKSEFARAGIASWTARMLCTVRLSRRLFPDRGSHSLDAIVARFGLDESERHRALGDARLLWRFTQRLYDRVPRDLIEDAVRSLLVRPGLPPALGPDALDRIPSAPGVYAMVGAAGHTLYVGKSVDMRSRVAAHFAGTGDERSLRLAREVERIDWERTAGELGALLREAQLIKQRLPAHNVALRRRLAQGALTLQDGRPRWVRAADPPEPPQHDHYGPFGSRAAARSALIRIAAEQGLCLKTMGLEGRRAARAAASPCFNHQLRRCRGACVGLESHEAHALRLREALAPWRIPAWPHPGAIALIEDGGIGAPCDWHVVDRWRWLGTAHGRIEACALANNSPHPPFDADQYRIVRSALERAWRGELAWVGLGSSL